MDSLRWDWSEMEIQLTKYQQKIFEYVKKYGINNIVWGGRPSGRATILKVLKECGYLAK